MYKPARTDIGQHGREQTGREKVPARNQGSHGPRHEEGHRDD